MFQSERMYGSELVPGQRPPDPQVSDFFVFFLVAEISRGKKKLNTTSLFKKKLIRAYSTPAGFADVANPEFGAVVPGSLLTKAQESGLAVFKVRKVFCLGGFFFLLSCSLPLFLSRCLQSHTSALSLSLSLSL